MDDVGTQIDVGDGQLILDIDRRRPAFGFVI
jgi:hypothetical protein